MQGREYIVDVYPRIPAAIARLEELANNLWYSWHRPTRALFGPLNPGLWNRVGHNPKLFLRRIDERELCAAATDPVFLANYRQVTSAYDSYLEEQTRQGAAAELSDGDLVAYFCAEYGLHESLHIYSGGLGILAGHHCKSASDLRLPFVAVGLLYRAGYFTQAIDAEGRQVASYVESEVENLPIHPARDAEGNELYVDLELVGRGARLKIWVVEIGHVRLFLLDSDVEGNPEDIRAITYQLYGGDKETRIRQEIILGEGGVKALRTLGLKPTVWHCNEGHAAFSILERARELVRESGCEFRAALEAVAACTVFTTHTPVPAGHDHFPDELAQRYLKPLATQLGIGPEELLALGRLPGEGSDFNMTTLAISGSRHHNGVSRIHGAVSSAICAKCWPQVPPEENPMGYITNGVHVPTVLSQDWCDLFDRSLGAEWRNHLLDFEYWERIREISDHLFWSVNQAIKSKMLAGLKEALRAQYLRNQVSEPHLERILRYIDPSDPNVLTITFARRFATYKRATLLFNDLGWLRELVSDPERPVVFIFAGKAHPADVPGQEQLKAVHEVASMPEFVGKILLVEGYDLALARRLVAGSDVWLNNPVYSMEASGTSGMKAAINGTINLSVTDGWWGEGFTGDNGWAIKPSPHLDEPARRDAEDARTLYETLQDEVIPLYYLRGKYGYAPGWVTMAKRSMSTVLPRFNMHRVLNEYIRELYIPAAHKGAEFARERHAPAQSLARWKRRVLAAWPNIALRRLDQPEAKVLFGEPLTVEVAAELNGLEPEDVVVELLVSRRVDSREVIIDEGFTPAAARVAGLNRREGEILAHARFEALERLANTTAYRYRVVLDSEWCGRLAYRVRMYPHHPMLTHPHELGRMIWL